MQKKNNKNLFLLWRIFFFFFLSFLVCAYTMRASELLSNCRICICKRISFSVIMKTRSIAGAAHIEWQQHRHIYDRGKSWKNKNRRYTHFYSSLWTGLMRNVFVYLRMNLLRRIEWRLSANLIICFSSFF